MELTPQSVRDVRFRQALRGYNPEDVDTFISNVVTALEELYRRLAEAEARATESESRSQEPSDVEDSLRRTLVLAQRTADMAVREAQEEASRLVAEAAAERDAVHVEMAELRERLLAEAEGDVQRERERLYEQRDALQRDVAALAAYLAQERERLRIYFTDQLRRVEDGVPGVESPPTAEGADRSAETGAGAGAAAGVAGATGEGDADATTTGAPGEPSPLDAGASPEAEADAADEAGEGVTEGEDAAEDDPFLAELRRAVTDTEPLGPRDEEAPPAPPAPGEPIDIFDDGEGGGRFLRRRR